MKKRLPILVFVTLSLLGANASAALLDTLYVTDGDSARLAIVQGTTATIKTTHVRGYPIAVRGDSNSIWIADYSASNPSREYDLNGNPTGNTAPCMKPSSHAIR